MKQKTLSIIGWVLTILASAMLLMGSVMMILRVPDAVKPFTDQYGYPASSAMPLGAVTAGCVILFLIPQTYLLGALLLTAYLGGAVATHVRAGEPFIMAIIFGVVIWISVLLREPRARKLLPLRTRGR
jgi:hypothetical protein